ncbi:MAG: thrombospondin type 3 repeat-containing protein, partial [Gammaproteobacteria bacterium]|nr:thrombospondin type 3 repeat-containing protein [Gammaproteobacteria bacterium]
MSAASWRNFGALPVMRIPVSKTRAAIFNAAQIDTDGDGTGDDCDSSDGLDGDGDGVANTTDNCAFVANAGQDDA